MIQAPPIGEIPHSPTINPVGETIKKDLLILGSAFTEITTEHIRDRANNLLVLFKEHLDSVEKSRVDIKAPFWAMCVAIDALKKEHCADLEIERQRIGILVGQYEQARRDQAKREQDERDAELARLEKLKEDARKADKEITLTFESGNLEPAQALGMKLDLEDEVTAAERRSDEVLSETLRAQAEERRNRPAGVLRYDIDIRVLDIEALHRAFPQYVLKKPDLVALKYHIRHYLKEGDQIPGVQFTQTPIFSAKAP